MRRKRIPSRAAGQLSLFSDPVRPPNAAPESPPIVSPSQPLDGVDFLQVVVPRADVEAANPLPTLGVLGRLVETPEMARRFSERVDIGFQGYDHVAAELWEIPEVRAFVHQLDEQFPYWLFFLSKQQPGLRCVLLCLLPPFLTGQGRARVFPQRMREILDRRWLPAMEHVSRYAGWSDEEVVHLAERVGAYLA